MNILYQFNDKYAPYAGVSLTSLFQNNSDVESISVWVLGEELSEENVSKLNDIAKTYARAILFIDSSKLIQKMKEINLPTYRGSYAANLRLFVSEIFPEDVERVIYLDSDTIVNGSLAELEQYDLKGRTLGMVYDSLGEARKEDLGLNKEEGYYNSGVILYDMKRWRDKDYTNAIIDHIKNVRASYPSPDQDLINVVCRGDICALPCAYNFQPIHQAYKDSNYFKIWGRTKYYSPQEVSASRNNVKIYHAYRFLGEFPWNKGNYHPDNERFDKYLAQSPWKEYTKSRGESGIATHIEKLLYRILPEGMFLRIFSVVHRRLFAKAEKMSREES